MKKLFFNTIVLTLFYSCNMDMHNNEEPESTGGQIRDLTVQIVLVDAELKDRLNPDSHTYFGDDFVDGINVYYLFDGKRHTLSELYDARVFGGLFFEEAQRNTKPIRPPGTTSNGGYSMGYYYILTTFYTFVPLYELIDDQLILTSYISYPDGSEDEVKVEVFDNNMGMVIKKKIWINGELAFDSPTRYYNEAFYPWLAPVFDDEGNQFGVMPKDGIKIVAINRDRIPVSADGAAIAGE